MPQKIPILVYHHVYADGHPELADQPTDKATGVIGEAEFRRHVEYVVREGWEVVSTSQLVDWLEEKSNLPERSVVVHFDNGWLDTLEVAMPALRESGMTGTCYVISDPTAAASRGEPAGVRTSTEGVVYKPFLTWNHVMELVEAGWEVGAHSATHPPLGDTLLQDGELAVLSEIEGSNTAYQSGLGFVPDHFAYPSGSRNERTDELLAPYYRSLRRWSFRQPPLWTFTNRGTSPLALECQNVDSTVSFDDFMCIFREAEY